MTCYILYSCNICLAILLKAKISKALEEKAPNNADLALSPSLGMDWRKFSYSCVQNL